MFVCWNHESVRLTGRWSRNAEEGKNHNTYMQTTAKFTTATAPGSYFEIAFEGSWAKLLFDLGYGPVPAPHLWVSIDGGAMMEVPVDRYLRIAAKDGGSHIVKVIYKGGMEQLNRWYAPLAGAISFIGYEAEAPGVLPPDDRKIIEFIGDSITEGVLTDADYSDVPAFNQDQLNRPYQDDNCATYAALTAEALNLRPIFQAYGAVGMTRTGCASVPRAGLLYPYVFDGVPYTGEAPDVIVINHGANDRAASAEEYLMRYREFLDLVRAAHPDAVIVALSAFCGGFDRELGEFIPAYNAETGASVHFISSAGWVPLEPLHPLRDGHAAIAGHLIPLLRKLLP